MTTPTVKTVNAGSAFTAMTTEMNSQSNGTTVTSSVIHSTGVVSVQNDLSGYPSGLAEFVGGSGSNMTANTTILGWWLYSIDGTNYESTAQAQQRNPDFQWTVTASTSQRLFCLYNAPPVDSKMCIQDNSGQALSASGNTVKLMPGTTQIPSI